MVCTQGELRPICVLEYRSLTNDPKGGLNNYVRLFEGSWKIADSEFALDQGIVTKYTLKTHKQTDVWVRSLDCVHYGIHVLMAHDQGALLVFEGDQIEPAYTAFAEWLSVGHDRKGSQLGAIAYSNGTVSS